MYSINLSSEFPVPARMTDVVLPQPEAVVHAGFPSPAADYTQRAVDLNSYLLRNKDASFLFTVRGESMTGAGIYDGDLLIVDRSLPAQHNHIVLAIVDEAFTVKRLYMRDGHIRLLPENPAFAPIVPSEGQELRIWGVATFNLGHLLHR